MIFGKSEKKRLSLRAALVVGGLAMFGAAGIVRKGKDLFSTAFGKMKGVVKKGEKTFCDMS